VNQPQQDPAPQDNTGGENAAAAGAAELQRLKEERDQLQDQLNRTLADVQNMRRRQRLEVEEARRRSLEGLAGELLPVLDNFALALQSITQSNGQDPKVIAEGIRMVQVLLQAALEKHGFREIAAASATFDPGMHEAVAVEPRSDVPPNQVLEVLQSGYMLGDRVLRFSRVRVSSAPSDNTNK
jgi:molecular chaperone GrpE